MIQRDDGLNFNKMSKLFGGRQGNTRPTLIKEQAGYLGPYPRILLPGMTQLMIFNEDDEGSLWMTQSERILRRQDVIHKGKTKVRHLMKKELYAKVQAAGNLTKGKLTNLQRAATNLGLSIMEEYQVKLEGWVGKEKGLLYTINGTKDQSGNISPETSLKPLMAVCTDFEEEEMILQTMAQAMGVTVNRTPKCHCELAELGMEYTWAL